MNPPLTCPGCGAPIPLALVRAGGACPYCVATILPAPESSLRTPARQVTAEGSASPAADALSRFFVGITRISPFLAGVSGGAAGWAWLTDGARLYIPSVLGLACFAVVLWRLSGAVIVPSLYAIGLGAWIALRPIVRPIPTGYGDTFSLTSETGLNWILPGAGLAALGVGMAWYLGWSGLREHVRTSKPHILQLVGFVFGLAAGWMGADESA